MGKDRESIEDEYAKRIEELTGEAQQILSDIEGVAEMNLSLFRAKPMAHERDKQPEAWSKWISDLSEKERSFVTQAIGYLGRLIHDPEKGSNLPDVIISEAREWILNEKSVWGDKGLKKTFVVKVLTSLVK